MRKLEFASYKQVARLEALYRQMIYRLELESSDESLCPKFENLLFLLSVRFPNENFVSIPAALASTPLL